MKIKRLIAAALIAAGVFTLTAPATPALAAATLVYEKLYVMGGYTPFDGEVQIIPRDGYVNLDFSAAIAADSIRSAITVTDATGKVDTTWYTNPGLANDTVSLGHETTLPKSATYTIHVKGGATGLRDTQGNTLAADVDLTVRANSESVERAVDIVTQYGQSQLVQSEIYELKLSAGMFRMYMTDFAPSARVIVMLENPATGERLISDLASASKPSFEVLVKDGTYRLLVGPNQFRHMALHGQDLEVSRGMPALQLPAMKTFETHNDTFTVQATITGSAAGKLNVTLDKDKMTENGTWTLADNAVRADGSIAPVTIDPTTMADGLYFLRAVATAKDSGNIAINARTFLVDRLSAFTDVPATHWARRYVEVMHHLGILNGRGEGTFVPGAPVTRAEFAKMLAGVLNLKPSGTNPAPFEDMPSDWSAPFIDALWEKGLIKGTAVDGKLYYYPSQTITRAEAATIVGRVLGVDSRDVSASKISFTDQTTIPTWARSSVLTLAELKWVGGFPDGSYGPLATLQRDQAARILGNFAGLQ